MKLRTPLQVQLYLTLAMEAGYQTGEKPITATLVESVLSRQLDDLEPTLTRHVYRLKDIFRIELHYRSFSSIDINDALLLPGPTLLLRKE